MSARVAVDDVKAHRVVVADLDGTLTNAEMHVMMWCFICQLGLFQRVLRTAMFGVFVPLCAAALLVRGEAASIHVLAMVLWGLEDHHAELGKKGSLKFIRGAMRHDVLAKIKAHQKAGCNVIVCSGNFNLFVEEFCEQEGFELLCTTLNYSSGSFSGTCGEPCVAIQKKTRITAHLSSKPHSFIHGYGNSKNDIPMLSMCPTGTVVDPCAELRSHAVSCNWEIVS
eukprot:TRINITY_DN17638_c0_g1_i1.p1 TRINITY_DN17638_c0_g1~~TRINITY_DN17638_c0_g1_i1.p1  ORF type:complete len:244 (+),score=47.28 TRINITY_DN17638_c0_g1_i1:58-732(+)